MKWKRKRYCDDCGKPLGSTVGLCYECGGSGLEPSRRERLADAEEWKIRLGVPWELIKEAHDYGSSRDADSTADGGREAHGYNDEEEDNQE